MVNKMRAIHPGEILKDELDALGLSANQFAMKLHVPANRITSILNGKRSITPETALRLAKLFGTTAEFWINLQTTYDLKQAYKRSWKVIDQEVEQESRAA
ncbi:MAG: HigA family addiction module antidote protein [Gammaproteobacteria bacterium]|nr:HigA family addiction module antidote protein [Gammaproteobacteria bacterium]